MIREEARPAAIRYERIGYLLVCGRDNRAMIEPGIGKVRPAKPEKSSGKIRLSPTDVAAAIAQATGTTTSTSVSAVLTSGYSVTLSTRTTDRRGGRGSDQDHHVRRAPTSPVDCPQRPQRRRPVLRRDWPFRGFIKRSHDGCDGRPGKVELLSGIEGASSRPAHKVVLLDTGSEDNSSTRG